MKVVGAQTVDRMIAAWRKARISAGEHVLGYPKTNVLHPEHGVGSARRTEEFGPTDAERVQKIVESMHERMREVFEAYHIGIICGKIARDQPHRARAALLGIDKSTYFRRLGRGWRFIQDGLTEATDF